MSTALLLVAAACAADPTTTDEYLQLVDEKQAVESSLATAESSLATAESELESANATITELEESLSEEQTLREDAEFRARRFESKTLQLKDDLFVWKSFVGGTVAQPFAWGLPFFDAFVLTCMADGHSRANCSCLADSLEEQMPLLDLLLISELLGAAELGLVPIDPVTGLPEGIPSPALAVLAEGSARCLVG